MELPPTDSSGMVRTLPPGAGDPNLEAVFNISQLRVMTEETMNVKKIAADMIEDYNLEEAFFVCDIGEVMKKHAEWLTHMPRVRPFYAVKCNDSPLVLETLAGLGTGFDCASKVEMRKVLDLGVSPKDIIFANPAKPRSHIVAAGGFGVRTVTFDSEVELYKLKKILPNARLVVRVRCEAEIAQCPLGMKFGVSVREATRLLAIAKSLKMDVVGVSFHVGSGCGDPPVFMRAIASARVLFDYAADELDYTMTLLDIGGGFPGNSGTSISEIAGVVNAALDRFFPEGCGVEIIAEPGRFYVASAFTLVAQIHSLREIRGEGDSRFMYYINDGVYGSFNCLLYDHHVVHPETLDVRGADCKLFECSIWGPTCDGLDQVCRSEYLPRMKVGEWVAFPDMGAYTLVAGGTFNGFPLPKLTTVATPEAWSILQNVVKARAFVLENVPVFLKSGLGYNRDAVGWGCVEMAVVGGIVTQYSSDEAEDGHVSMSASSSATASDSDSAAQDE